MTQRSALWMFGGALLLLMACGLAWKWTEPIPVVTKETPVVEDTTSQPIQEPIVVTNEEGTFTLTMKGGQQGDSLRQTATATNNANGKKSIFGTLLQEGDEIVLARGNANLAATFNRAGDGLPASSVTFTDDSDTQITLTGSWEHPTITFDLAAMFAQDKLIIFSLPQADGTLARYQYDPSAKERLSLIP